MYATVSIKRLILRYIICISVTITSFSVFGSVSYNEAQNIANKLNGKPIKLQVIDKPFMNAYGGWGRIAVTRGSLNKGNRAMLIAILAHELSHAKGMASEVGADIASVGIARKVGLDVCPGAIQFLMTIGKKGGGTHPDGLTRLKRMRCIF